MARMASSSTPSVLLIQLWGHFWSPKGTIPITRRPTLPPGGKPWALHPSLLFTLRKLQGISHSSGLILPCPVSLGSLSGVDTRSFLF